MTVDPSIVLGLLFLLAELVALAGIGYVIVRVALRETDRRVALAQGLVVGPAIWGVVVNLVMYALPGMPGAIAGWIFVLALAAVLVWRSPNPLRPQLRTAALFALAALALFWAALASRQTWIPHIPIHLGLSASIRAGGFPPELPWNPGAPAPYHYGVDMLVGLLAPPSGPDLAFVMEIVGAYAWVCFALVVITALLRRASGLAVLMVAPLLLTAAAWGLWNGEPPGVAEVPAPVGSPAAGIRASLAEIYWRAEQSHYFSVLANVSKPTFTFSYALAFVVLTHAAGSGRRSWPWVLTLATLIGFLGLTSTSLTPLVMALSGVLEAVRLIRSRLAGSPLRSDLVRLALGLALAVLLAFAGSLSSLVLGGSATSGISPGASHHFGGWRLLGALDRLPGGVGLVSLGPLIVVAFAVLLAPRNRLVHALTTGTGLLLLAPLFVHYEPFPWDIVRLEGHARNFALFALLIALATRLSRLNPPRWRYAAGAAVVVLAVWPTTIASARHLAAAIDNKIELSNATQSRLASDARSDRRFVLKYLPTDRIPAYVRRNAAVDARIFSPHPNQMTYATGRPNASGFGGLLHLQPKKGPAYRDVRGFLEPAAVRRLGFEYVHAPDSWVQNLPEEAVSRLNDPNLFELLVRDDSESLYRVLPSFLALDPPPASGSYEALRQAVPASTTVFLPAISESGRSDNAAPRLLPSGAVRAQRLVVFRTAWSLSHARLRGVIDPTTVQWRTPLQAEPLDNNVADLIILPLDFPTWTLPRASRQPIWWNDETAVYALGGSVEPIMRSPAVEPLQFMVRVSNVSEADGRITFTATIDNRAHDQWSGQDWIVVATETPPWNIATQLRPDAITPVSIVWFSGQVRPDSEFSSVDYEFDFVAPAMVFRRGGDEFSPTDASGDRLEGGDYLLAMRLRHESKPDQWRDAAIIPVLRITVSETGEVSYQVHKDAGG
ncbi:MAG: hypothetical protein OXG11_01255 [Chloroflexi bacterium]|nr:hypothetical protein [Chloroflexota bacterium]